MSKSVPASASGLSTELRFRVLDKSDATKYCIAIHVEDLVDPEISVSVWEHKLFVEAHRQEDCDSIPPKPKQALFVNRPLPYNVQEEDVTAYFMPDTRTIVVEAQKNNVIPMALEVPSNIDHTGSSSAADSDMSSKSSTAKRLPVSKKLSDLTLQNYCPPPANFMLKVKDVVQFYANEFAKAVEEKAVDVPEVLAPSNEPEPIQINTFRNRAPSGPAGPQSDPVVTQVVTDGAAPPSWYVPRQQNDDEMQMAMKKTSDLQGITANAIQSDVPAGVPNSPSTDGERSPGA